MLSKAHRLTKKKDFEEVFKNGKAVKDNRVLIKYQKNGLLQSRLGVVVSKKVSSKATVRNKVKRRIRKAFGGQLKASPSMDVIVVALPGIADVDFLELKTVAQKFFTRFT